MSTSSPRPLDHPDLVWSAGQVRPRRFGTEDRASIVDSARAFADALAAADVSLSPASAVDIAQIDAGNQGAQRARHLFDLHHRRTPRRTRFAGMSRS